MLLLFRSLADSMALVHQFCLLLYLFLLLCLQDFCVRDILLLVCLLRRAVVLMLVVLFRLTGLLAGVA